MSQISPYANMSSLGGALTFSGGGANAMQGLGGSPSQALSALGGDYASAYNAALQANQTMYNNILSGYQSTLSQQVSAEQGVSQGYNALYGNVMNTIQGADTGTLQAIQRAYTQQSGTASQEMINAGLGNTTVQESTQAGLTGQDVQAQTAAQNQYAQLQAGYQSQLGLSGLGYANQAIMQNTAEANQQLGFMNSVMMPYPNAGMYGQLAQGYGALQAAMAARGMLGGRGPSGSPTFGPTGGYSPYNQGGILSSSGAEGGLTFGLGTQNQAPIMPGSYGSFQAPGSAAASYDPSAEGEYSEAYGAANNANPYAAYDLSAGIGTS